MSEPTPSTYERVLVKLDELDRIITRTRNRAFWAGVLCGIGGTYLGYVVASLLG